MKINLLLIAILLISVNAFSQKATLPKPNYKTAIGIKFSPFGATIKSMTDKRNAVEILGYFRDGFRLTLLWEYHGRINENGNFKWYIGGGGHAGFANKSAGGGAKLGVDGILGLDYKFLNLPLDVTLDWQPALSIGDNSTFNADYGGIGVRFCF